ncbi:hypothetical protein E3N88_08433 [Mikania micrantha]|uniref:Reverse transcriptase Ty1/copia-type domain-containing protein n=1 Tax=Mikania micrantha TaxID=192012 RepID=A0A5N6PH55_9ASTR|nr:hypothetical protein E3N88_08433 [Mikania micrantha]
MASSSSTLKNDSSHQVKKMYDATQAENPEKLSVRNEAQKKGRFKRLSENGQKWVAAYREAYRQRKSGMNQKDIESEAHKLYEQDKKNKFTDYGFRTIRKLARNQQTVKVGNGSEAEVEAIKLKAVSSWSEGSIWICWNPADASMKVNISWPAVASTIEYICDLGEASYVIGIGIHRNRSIETLGLSQKAYIERILKRFNMQLCSPSVAPVVKGGDFGSYQCPKSEAEIDQMRLISYASVVGSLMYAQVCTRPDIAYIIGMLGRYQSNPGLDHWKAAKKCKDDKKSTSGYIFMLLGGPISWKSHKQQLTTTSTMMVEYVACYNATCHAVLLRNLIKGLKVVNSIQRPMKIYCDNSVVVSFSNNNSLSGVGLYLDTKYLFVRERVEDHSVNVSVDQDDEYQDMDDMTFVENENEVQTDDSDDELGIEDDVQIQERLQGSKLEKEIEFPESKKRGPTMLHVVHMRKVDDREMIICNEFGQPVGPVTNEKDVVGRFSRFLGTIARNHSYAPLIHSSWHKVPHKDKIWEYILEKYDVPDAAKKWVLMTIGHSYKVHKCRFKKKHFYQFRDDKTRWKNRPKSIPEGDFAQLLRLWNNTNVKINDDSNKELPTLTKMFEHTRKRTERRAYVDTYDDTQRKIEQMKNYKSSENESASVDPFTIVMNKENSGYCRLYGRGVTNRLIKKLNGGDTTCTFPGGLMESFNASFEGQKHELLKMRKELDEEHERKKTELEAIQLDIKNQQEHLEATMRKLLEQLPRKD